MNALITLLFTIGIPILLIVWLIKIVADTPRPYPTRYRSYNKKKRKHYPVSPESIGQAEETEVARVLSQLPKSLYFVLHDVCLKLPNRRTTQIDHIIFSPYGIFVIETKNYSGLLKGRGHDKNWMQFLGQDRNVVYNPLKQNQGHIWALQKLLSCHESNFINIVTFSPHATLDIYQEKKDGGTIVSRPFLLSHIVSQKTQILSVNQAKQWYHQISKANRTDSQTRKEHIQQVNSTKTTKHK